MSTTKRDNGWYLSSAPIVQALVHLCVPMAAALIVTAVYNVINAGFIGSLDDTRLLAAITFGVPVLTLVLTVGSMFGIGGGALVARLLGASENDPSKAGEIKHASAFATWGSVLTGVAVGGLGLILLHPLVSLLGADAAAVPATRAYVGVLLAITPVLAASVCLQMLLRAEGAARQAMVGTIASAIANLVFDVLFILVLGWGVAGAALSVGIANAIVIVYYVTWLRRNSKHMRLAPRWFTLRRSISGPVMSVGVSQLLQVGFVIVTLLVLNNLASTYGDGPVSAMGVAVRIAQIPEFLVMGITFGVMPLLAFSFGKGDRTRLNAALRGAAIAVGGISVVFAAAVLLFRDQVFTFFVADPTVFSIGVTILTAQLVAMVANGFTGLITTLFQSTGRGLAATVMSMTQGLLFIPVVLLANLWFGLPGLIWALTVTEGALLVVGLLMWLANRGAIERGLAEAGQAPVVEESEVPAAEELEQV